MGSRVDGQAIKVGLFHNFFLWDQCEARTKTVRPFTLGKKKKRKKKATKHPRLPTRTKELSERHRGAH